MNPNHPEKPVSETPPAVPTIKHPEISGDPDLALLEEAIEVTETKTRESTGEKDS